MKKRFLTPLLLVVIAATAVGQQLSLQLQPLPAASAQAVSAAPLPESSDPRVLQLAGRLKTAVGQVPDANPAELPVPLAQTNAAQMLQGRAAGPLAIRMRHNTGTPRFIEAARLEPAAGTPAWTSGGAHAGEVATARNFLRANKDLLRLDDPDNELVLQKTEEDSGGLDRKHLRFSQQYRGIPVWPAEVGVHLAGDGSVDVLTGAYVPTPDVAITLPAITAEMALDHARQTLENSSPAEVTANDLIIYAPGEQTPRLAWKVQLLVGMPEHWVIVVDAQDGRILTRFNQVCYARASGSGVDVGGQTRPLVLWEQNGSYFLVDTSKQMFDPSSQPPAANTTRGGIVILDARNQPPGQNPSRPEQVFNIVSTNPNSFTPAEGVSAAFNLSAAYDYFLERHNRNSLDGKGSTILALVRFGSSFDNAFWNGQFIALGDGDTWANSLDFIGHELAHAVTETSANLVYQFQSGAMNESFSDIFGEMIEHRTGGSNDWLLGSGLSRPLRNMANPATLTFGGRPYPTKMTEYFQLSANQDAGGVHVNSSILNRCFYLVAEGLQGAIGRRSAERIFYRALTVYLMRNSQFIDARLACVRSAQDLFGANSAEVQRVAQAFDTVEIFDSQPTPQPQEFKEVAAPDSALFLYGNQNNGFFLARRESALQDPAEGRFLGQSPATPRQPAVTGAGDLAIYVTADNDCALLRTDGQSEQKLGFAGAVHSVGMSPDGKRFGFVLRDANGPDNQISVIDLAANTTRTYELRAPATDAGTVGTILFADAMTFTADGRFLIYDALNSIRLANGTEVSVFSIYALELATGKVFPLIPPTQGANIGNPSIAKTSDNFIVAEAVDVNTGRSTVFTANLNSGKITVVGAAGTFSYPCYSGDDKAIIYSEVNSAAFTGLSILRRAVADDRQTPVGERALWINDGGFPFVYRRGAFQGPPQTITSSRLANISTRATVRGGDDVLIGGFIVQGSVPKKVIVRAIGPSLQGVSGALADPTLELFRGGNASPIGTNDDWQSTQRQEIFDSTIPPNDPRESAIVTTLDPGDYTVVIRGKGGATGVALVEVYDLDPKADSRLANISTRASVGTDQNVMIGGFIVQGPDPKRVILRAIGPSLPVSGKLEDTTLELYSGENLLRQNDNWESNQRQEIIDTTVAPTDPRESAIVATLTPGAYTVVVRGAGNSTGVALVEAYQLQ